MKNMKKGLSLFLVLATVLSCVFVFCACGDEDDVPEGLWADAIYTEDKTFGNGSKTVAIEVKAGENSVTLTVKTDKETLADVLLEHALVGGDITEYGLAVYVINGMRADWNTDGAYWGMYKNGEYLMTGASSTIIADGEHYEFVYTKN